MLKVFGGKGATDSMMEMRTALRFLQHGCGARECRQGSVFVPEGAHGIRQVDARYGKNTNGSYLSCPEVRY